MIQLKVLQVTIIGGTIFDAELTDGKVKCTFSSEAVVNGIKSKKYKVLGLRSSGKNIFIDHSICSITRNTDGIINVHYKKTSENKEQLTPKQRKQRCIANIARLEKLLASYEKYNKEALHKIQNDLIRNKRELLKLDGYSGSIFDSNDITLDEEIIDRCKNGTLHGTLV